MADENKQLLGQKTGRFKKFASENKFLVISSIILAILIIILVIVYWRIYFSSGKSASNTNPLQGTSNTRVEVLPQQQRQNEANSTKTTTKASTRASNADPFAGTPVLKGILISGDNKNSAIIVDGGSTYIAGVGQKVSGYWKVEKIEGSTVTLNADGREKVITLDSTGGAVDITNLGGNAQ